MAQTIVIETAGAKDTGRCPDCGNISRCVWGYAYSGESCLAAYFVHWTIGHIPEHGANIDLILGKWGERATREEREAVALAYRLLKHGPSMMVIDASTRPVGESELAGRALSRVAVIGTPLADQAFAVADAILAQDARVGELLGG